VSRLQEEEEAGQQDEEKEKEAVLALYDDEDDRIRNQLAAPIEPTLDLAPFLAHQDYVGHVVKEGIAGHVERIYRDINSMVDTLGLNARSLTSYINGHAEVTGSSAGLGREELDDESKQWRVDELFKLEDIQGELERSVEQGRVTEVLNALAALATLSRDVSNLKRDSASIRRFLEMKKSPDLELRRRAAPLEAGWSAAERKLRSRVAEFQKQMAEAEDKATVLRAKIASHSSKGVPTVEAVENTIRKMTSMVEKRSGDIDVLEMQMRKLGLVGGTGTPKKKHVGSSEVGMSLTLAYGEERSGDGDGKFDQAVGRALELRVRRRTMLTLLKEGLEKRSADGVAVTP
jgi:nucleoporin NUP159